MRCAGSYFYTYIQKTERKFSPAAALGNIVHAVLEQAYSHDQELTRAEMIMLFDEQVDHYDPEHVIEQDDLYTGLNMLFEYVDRTPIDEFVPREDGLISLSEMPFNVVIGSALLNGYMDHVFVTDKVVSTIDYKTGKFEVKQATVAQDLQIGIYALVLDFMFPGRKVKAEIHYLRSGRTVSHVYSKEDLEEIKIRLIDGIKSLIEDSSFKLTEDYGPCIALCDHSKTGVCSMGAHRISRKKKNPTP